MKTAGNVIWFVLIGWIIALLYIIIGTGCMISLVFIPYGIEIYKHIGTVAFPFGKEVYTNFDLHPVANVFWLMICGLKSLLAFGCLGVILCITLIGIPFGLQCFKIARLMFLPCGAQVVRTDREVRGIF